LPFFCLKAAFERLFYGLKSGIYTVNTMNASAIVSNYEMRLPVATRHLTAARRHEESSAATFDGVH
jgi:hypothetical protein